MTQQDISNIIKTILVKSGWASETVPDDFQVIRSMAKEDIWEFLDEVMLRTKKNLDYHFDYDLYFNSINPLKVGNKLYLKDLVEIVSKCPELNDKRNLFVFMIDFVENQINLNEFLDEFKNLYESENDSYILSRNETIVLKELYDRIFDIDEDEVLNLVSVALKDLGVYFTKNLIKS